MNNRQGYVEGVFQEEIKNRFLCTVRIKKQEVECYIPSSCRLSNFLDLSGRKVLLRETKSANARTRYSVFAMDTDEGLIILELSRANRLIENSIMSRRFAFLGDRTAIKRECKIEGYKSDLFIERAKYIIEVKSILSFDKRAVFPSVYSERAIEQLKHLCNLLSKGYKVCYAFVSMNPKVREIQINNDMYEFYSIFIKCLENGMEVRGYSVEEVEDQFILGKKLRIRY